MDSRAVASALDTDPKTLRRFLRSDASSVTPVGSGGRYVFQPSDVATMREEFGVWVATDRKPVTARLTPPKVRRTPCDRDQGVWDDEGPVVMPPLSDPRVLAHVRAMATHQERKLMAMVRAAGLTTDSRSSARV